MNIETPTSIRCGALGFDLEHKVKCHPKTPPALLSLDGGGVKGITTTIFLEKIEKATALPICQLFDVFAAASTGTIIACALNTPKDDNPTQPLFTAREMTENYESLASQVFSTTLWERMTNLWGLLAPKYSAKKFELLLDGFFKEKTLNDLMNPIWFPVSILQDSLAKGFTKETSGDRPIKQVIRACTAAPTYFSAPIVQSDVLFTDLLTGQTITTKIDQTACDGGMFANNPVVDGMIYTREKFSCGYGQLVCSLGTGYVDYSLSVDQSKNMGLYQWLKGAEILNVIFKLQSSATLARAEKMIENTTYLYSLNPRIAALNDSLDDASPANLKALKDSAQAWFDDPKNGERFEELCSDLKKHYCLSRLNE